MKYNRNVSQGNLISRRSFILMIVNILAFIVIAVRLFFMQILNSGEYRSLFERNSIKFLLLEPKRGKIFDRNNIILADNEINYRLYFYKQREHEFREILSSIFRIIRIDHRKQEALYKTIKQSGYVYPVLISDHLSWEQVTRIESTNLPGVYVDKAHTRIYPLASVCAHVVGYMGVPSSAQIREYKLYNNSEFRVGKAGIEKSYDRDFIGEFGNKKVEVNARRAVVREFAYNKSTSGVDRCLSIDSHAQQYVYDIISKDGATAILSDIKKGEILAMASTPSFDSNIFNAPIDSEVWKQILTNKSYPFTNKALGKLYPPGSIWKIVVALAILRAGISSEKSLFCAGSVMVGNRKYRCWKSSGHGYVSMNKAIACSCNCYFYEMSMLVGIENIKHMGSVLGFGEKSGIELPGELPGINPDKSWKKKVYGNQWMLGDTANSSIGQGYTSVTPLQLSTMMARIASGKKVSLSILLESAEVEDLGIDEEHLNHVRAGLSSVFNSEYGIGYKIRIPQKKHMVAGKTGTSQVISQDSLGMSDKNLKSHSIFSGYAPVHDPRYGVTVVIDNAGWGSKTAAPIGKDILYFAQKHIT